MEHIESSGSEEFFEGRNVVLESLRAGKQIEKLFIQKNLYDGAINTIVREAKKHDVYISFVAKERLDQMSTTGHHQGVIAKIIDYSYSTVDDILDEADAKNEDPFIIILDGVEDPHNLGAIIRTANIAGAHGIIIKKHGAASLGATAARASAGAINYTKVAKVTNISKTIEDLKKRGLWIISAAGDGDEMYKSNLTGKIALVMGNEGSGVSELVKKNSDMIVSIPMHGDIESLNVSVATGVLAYEVLRQRRG